MVDAAPAHDPRVAEAVARLLARQSSLLARSGEDDAAAVAARLGLSWLGDLLRSFGLTGAGEWFQALRAHADARGAGASAAWAALAAPWCETFAAEVRRAGSLAPLTDGAHDWTARIADLNAFAPPGPAEPAPPAPAPNPPSEPASEDAQHRLFESISEISGDEPPDVRRTHGRVELEGRTGVSPEGLARLDRVVRAGGGVVLARHEADGEHWTVRLPMRDAPHYLFAERAGTAIAIPWHRVIEYGLAPGGERARIVIGLGLARREIEVEWLFGKGPGAPARGEVPAPERPAGFRFAGRVEDAEGRPAHVLEEVPDSALPTAPAPASAAPPPHAVQPERVPADNPPGTRPPAPVRALVADDSMTARVFLGRLLAQRGIAVDEAEDGAQARAALGSAHYDVVFLDAEMPGAGALEILADVDADWIARTCVLIKDDDERSRVQAFGPVRVLYKPFAEEEVRGAVDALIARLPLGS